MYYVYIIRSVSFSRRLYVGFTTDLFARVADHNEGKCVFTKKFRPWNIVHSEQFETESFALKRERQLKGWSRAKKEAIIRGDFGELKRLSKRQG